MQLLSCVGFLFLCVCLNKWEMGRKPFGGDSLYLGDFDVEG